MIFISSIYTQSLALLYDSVGVIILMSTQLPLLSEDPFADFKPSIRSTLLENYDPTAYPPDLQFAQKHGRSQAVGRYVPSTQNVQRCRCCLEAVHKDPLPLICDLSELRHCGESTPLYFTFVKQIILLLAINCLLITVPAVLINYLMGEQCQIVNQNSTNFFDSVCKGSAINIMNIEIIDAMEVEAILFFIAVLINIVFIAYLQVKMEDKVRVLQSQPSSADYSFVIKGLPPDINIKELQKYVQDKLMFSGAPDVEIIKIYIIYNFKDYMKSLQKRKDIVQQRIAIRFSLQKLQQNSLSSKDYEQKLRIKQQITTLQAQLKTLGESFEKIQIDIQKFQQITNQLTLSLRKEGQLQQMHLNKDTLNFSGKCIVTVNNRRSRDVIIKAYSQKSCFHQLAYRLSELLQGKKSKIMLSPAPQPSDILFGNMGSKKTIVWKRRIFYSLLIGFLVLFDFVVVALTKKFLKEQKAIQKGNIIFSFINSIIVSFFCAIFRRIIAQSQAESYYTTLSKMSYNRVAKMVVIFQINMLLTTLVANVASFYLIKQDKPTFPVFPLNFEAFLFDLFFLIATNPIITLTLTVLDHRHFRGLLKRMRVKNGWVAVSQAQANISYENMNFDICYKYGTIYRFLFFSAGIAILYPLCFPICLFAISSLYWLDKYLLLRRYAVTIKITSRFTLLCQGLMGQFPIYLSLTNLLVMFIPIQDGTAFQEQKYSKGYYYISLIAVILSCCNYFIGNGWIKWIVRSALGKKSLEFINGPTYKQIQNSLLTDYSHDYPYFRVNKKIGLQSQSESLRKDKLKELRANQKLGVFQVLQQFISYKRYNR